jgi:hypothetical protein
MEKQKKKFSVEFIEEPEILDFEDMSKILGGNSGLCVGFSICSCNSTSREGFTNCKKDKPEKEKSKKENKKDKFFVKKYKDTLCFIVTIRE